MGIEQEYYKTRELAELLNIAISTIEGWRRDGRGPKHTLVGDAVRYAKEDIKQWLADNTRRRISRRGFGSKKKY